MADLCRTVSPITLVFTERQMTSLLHHRDTFDRPLVAQGLVETIPLMSADAVFDQYGVNRLWA